MPNPRTAEFARRLNAALAAKDWSQSDLASAIWGAGLNKHGHRAACNRCLISSYCLGKSVPSRRNLRALAAALGVAPADLVPDAPPPPPYQFQPAGPGQVRLTVDTVLPAKVAAMVIALLAGTAPEPAHTPESSGHRSSVSYATPAAPV